MILALIFAAQGADAVELILQQAESFRTIGTAGRVKKRLCFWLDACGVE